jgi:hypothetical protein
MYDIRSCARKDAIDNAGISLSVWSCHICNRTREARGPVYAEELCTW